MELLTLRLKRNWAWSHYWLCTWQEWPQPSVGLLDFCRPQAKVCLMQMSLFSPQVNEIHSFTNCLQSPQGSWNLWVLRHPQSRPHCSVHLYTKTGVSAPVVLCYFGSFVVFRCFRTMTTRCSLFFRSAVVLLFFQKPFSSGKVISKRQVCSYSQARTQQNTALLPQLILNGI